MSKIKIEIELDTKPKKDTHLDNELEFGNWLKTIGINVNGNIVAHPLGNVTVEELRIITVKRIAMMGAGKVPRYECFINKY